MQNWSVEDKKCAAEKCSWAENQTGRELIIDESVVQVMKALCDDVKDEWQILLIGTIKEGNAHATDYYIPKQTVSGGHVTHEDMVTKQFIDENKIIATVHSHSHMGVFFSQTDVQDTNMSLIDYHVVVNNKMESVGCCKTTLPCGMHGLMQLKVIMGDVPQNVIIKGRENITKSTLVTRLWNEGTYAPPLDKFHTVHGYEKYSYNNFGAQVREEYDEEQFGDIILKEGVMYGTC